MKSFSCFKNEMIVLMVIAVGVFSSAVFAAGTQGSGGGGAFSCYEPDHQGSPTTNVYLLDLWEGENLPIGGPKLNIPRSNEPVWDQFAKAVNKLKTYDPFLPEELTRIAKELFDSDKKLNLFSGRKISLEISPPADALNAYKKKDCDLVGMMYFNGETQKLDVDFDHFNKLANNTEIAAAMLHEAWYFLARSNSPEQFPVINSVKTRKLVACVFSTDAFCWPRENTYSKMPEDVFKVVKCQGEEFSGELRYSQIRKKMGNMGQFLLT